MIVENGGSNFASLILPFLILVIVGIIGIVIWLIWIFSRNRRRRTDEVVIPEPTSEPASDAYLLGVRRSITGDWEIRVKGQRYRTLEAVSDDAVRQEIVAGLRELVAFARSYVQKTEVAQKQAAPPPEAGPVAAPALPREAPSPTRAPAPDAAVESPAPAAETVQPRAFLKRETPLKRPAAQPTLMPAIDLAREIGEIVAEMQAKIPSLRDRSIRLQNALDGGIQFAIDGITYGDAAEIPDEEIRALIRAATKEWERR